MKNKPRQQKNTNPRFAKSAKPGFKSPSKAEAKPYVKKTSNSPGAGPSRQRHQNEPRVSGQIKSFSFPKNWRQVAGHHAIIELIQVRAKSIKHLLIQKNWETSNDLRTLMDHCQKTKITVEEKTDAEMQKICPSHQGAVAFSDHTLEFNYTNSGWKKNSLVLALDGVEDPHNLGAIMRTSWLMDVSGIILPVDRAVGLTATVHKVACGGVEHVPLAQTNNFSEPFKKLKEDGFWVFGMSHKATKTIYDLKMPERVVWVMGAEDKGLRIPTERACDELVSIPQMSANASYNVSVATALALAETKRQWNL